MISVSELTSNPKYHFEDLRIMIVESNSENEVLAFVGKYSNPKDHFGQGLIDANNLWRNKDCPSVSERTPSKRPDGYVVVSTTTADDIGYTLMVSRDSLDLLKNEDFIEKVSKYKFNF